MEEDVEIEMLFKTNEKILMEAANETHFENSGEHDRLEQNVIGLAEETKSSYNKENMTENMICDIEETYQKLTDASERVGQLLQVSEPCKQSLKIQDNTAFNLDSFQKTQSNLTRPFDKIGCIESADDQVNQRILDLISTDPVKYYLSQQTSYIEQFGDDDDNDDFASSGDDWDDYFTNKDNDEMDNALAESQFECPKKPSDNKNLQKLETKALPQLTTLGKMLLKRANFLSELENKLHKLSQDNKIRQRELQDALIAVGKSKSSDSSASRYFFRKFGMPYFSDDKGFYAPPNKDHQEKLEKEEIIIETIPKTVNWTKEHKESMKKAIREVLIAEKSTQLTKEIQKLTETLKQMEGNVSKVLEKITEKQNELRAIYKKSLKELVGAENENREYDWMKFSISLFDGLHSAEECKKFWNIYLKPSINKNAWTPSEDSKLLRLAEESNYEDWEKIATSLGTNRSGFQCFVHLKGRLETKSEYSGKWTTVEDKKLMTVVNSSKVGGFIPWTKVSSYMGNRNHSQIYNRWANSLNPELVKGRFTKEEDLLIVAGVEVFGVTFKELAVFIKNRTSSQIRERYERHLQPKTGKVGNWSLEEDEKLLELVKICGEQNWAEISSKIKTRTRTQVRQRYAFIKKMMEKKPGWTISQVKRKNISFCTKLNKTLSDVDNMKKVVSDVTKVFQLSGIEKESFLLQKLVELKSKISSKRKVQNRGRKKRYISGSSQVSDALLDYFTNCHTNPLSKTKRGKSFKDDSVGSILNELFLLQEFLGHNIRLPKTEREIWENPRLSFDSKCLLHSALKTNMSECGSMRLTSSTLSSSKKIQKRSSKETQKPECRSSDLPNDIDCPVPGHDDTIIMMDWWHTPPVNVTGLNFSEFFKRTVFDYSNGMHKDIWDSKVKRSQEVNRVDECSVNTEEEQSPTQNYYFPPNLFNTLGMRSLLLGRAILERQVKDLYPDRFVKEELYEETEVGINSCSQLENVLLNVFMWPKVLTGMKIEKVPIENNHIEKRICENSLEQENLPGCSKTNLGTKESCILSESVEDKSEEKDKQPEHIAKKRRKKPKRFEPVKRKKLEEKRKKKRGMKGGNSKKCSTLKENNSFIGQNSETKSTS